jgi:hypothetical protein
MSSSDNSYFPHHRLYADINTCFLCTGQSEDSPLSSETLCRDVRERVVSKLSLREHASVAPACREFQQQLLTRVGKERAACMSTAEETFGKGLFWGFVTAVQRVMCGLGPSLQNRRDRLVIDAAGGSELITENEKDKWRSPDGHFASLRRWGHAWVFQAVLLQELPGSGGYAAMVMDFFKDDKGNVELLFEFDEVAAEAATGVLLAICTGNPEATPAHWQSPLKQITLTRTGELGGWWPHYAVLQYGCAGAVAECRQCLCVCMCGGGGGQRGGRGEREREREREREIERERERERGSVCVCVWRCVRVCACMSACMHACGVCMRGTTAMKAHPCFTDAKPLHYPKAESVHLLGPPNVSADRASEVAAQTLSYVMELYNA